MLGRVIIMTEIITAIPTLTSDTMAMGTAGVIIVMITITTTTALITGQWHRMVATMAAMTPATPAAFIQMLSVDFMAPQLPWVESTSVVADSLAVEDSTAAADSVVVGSAEVDSTGVAVDSTVVAVDSTVVEADTAKRS
jgi:hypothetical protein